MIPGIQRVFISGFVSVDSIFKKNIASREIINKGKFHRFEKVALNRHIAARIQMEMFDVLK